MKKGMIFPLLFVCTLFAMISCQQDESLEPNQVELQAQKSNLSADEVLETTIDPADFVTGVDNPYFPLRPGETYEYLNTSREANETEYFYIRSTVTCSTKMILDVATTVVHVVETDEEGTVLEDTYDWYAQDKEGNVWYFGEYTLAYEDGEVSSEGSWEAGVDGAQPGIIMWADPWAHIGETYYQEYYEGEAEDQGRVLPSKRTVKVPYGMFHQTLTTEDFTALEPGAIERKSYVKGIGVVLAESAKGGKEKEREELVQITYEACE